MSCLDVLVQGADPGYSNAEVLNVISRTSMMLHDNLVVAIALPTLKRVHGISTNHQCQKSRTFHSARRHPVGGVTVLERT